MSAKLFFLPYQVATVNGIAQPGAQLFFYQTGTLTKLPIYTTNLLDVQLSNPVIASGAGRFADVYLDSTQTYRLIVKDKNGATLDDIDPYIPGTVQGLVQGNESSVVATRAEMATLVGPAGACVFLTETAREGMFVFSAADLSANVTADPNQGIYVALASDTTGAIGAWVRKTDASFRPYTAATLPIAYPARAAYVSDYGFGKGVPAFSDTARWFNLRGIPLPVATGVFFDSSAGDTFTGSKVSLAADATLTIGASSVAFSSAAAVTKDLKIKRSDGSVVTWCFDTFTIDATYTVTSFPAVDSSGVWTGVLNSDYPTNGSFSAELRAHPASATTLLDRVWNSAANLGSGSSFVFTPGAVVRSRYVKSGTNVTTLTTYPATADSTITIEQVFAATSYEMQRLFSAPFVRFAQGVLTLTALKVSAAYPNAKFAFVGDSITQGRFATTHPDGFAQKVRADHPGQVLVAAAPASQTSDWLVNIKDVVAMAPRFAFVLLGTNDFSMGRSLAAVEADYTTIVNQLIAANITPIVLTVPPKNDSQVPLFNTWLKAQGWKYIDIYPLLLGSGTSMHATYDNGDGIHPNTAGHRVIYEAVAAAILAQGLGEVGAGNQNVAPTTLWGNPTPVSAAPRPLTLAGGLAFSGNTLTDLAWGTSYRTLADSSGSITAASAAGTYGMGQGDPLAITGTGTLYPLNIIYIAAADYPAIGTLTAKLRIRANLQCNDVAPGVTFTIGLHPVTRPGTSGGAGVCIYTLGTAVASSTVAIATPAADSSNVAVTAADFALPADGYYVIGVVTSGGALAASSHCHVSARLQMRYT